MGRYMAELGITPASRPRVAAPSPSQTDAPILVRVAFEGPDGTLRDQDGNVVDGKDMAEMPQGAHLV